MRGESSGFAPYVFRYVRVVTQRSRSGEDTVSSRMRSQTQQTGRAASVRRTSLSSERKALHELSEQTVLQEPCATSFFSIYPPDKPFPRVEQVLMDHKAFTARAGHRRNSTCTGRGACEGRLFTQVVSGAGLPPSIRVMPREAKVLRRRRTCPSSRAH